MRDFLSSSFVHFPTAMECAAQILSLTLLLTHSLLFYVNAKESGGGARNFINIHQQEKEAFSPITYSSSSSFYSMFIVLEPKGDLWVW